MFEGWKIEDVFRIASELGFDGVEIAPFTLANSVEEISSSKRREIAQAAKSAGVEIVGLHWLLVKPEGMYINHEDESVRQHTRNYLDELIKFCADLGGKVLIFGSPKQRSVREGITYEQAWDYAKETFSHCANTARDVGVFLCIEALPSRETNFINTVAEALRMVREVNKPHFRTMLDVKSMCAENKPIPDIIREANGFAMHVHANDASGKAPGAGETDFFEIAVALKEIGFDGYISIEVFDFKPDAVTIARNGIAYLKRAFGN